MRKTQIDEILERKARGGDAVAGPASEYFLTMVREEFKRIRSSVVCFADFIPNRLITIVEVCVRHSIAELIDVGSPYSERGEQLVKGAKIDFLFALSLEGKKLSVGDMVVNAVSLNNVTQVISCLEALIPNFVEELRVAHERWTEDASDFPLLPIIEDYDYTMRIMKRLFEVRHILVHELLALPPYKPEEVDQFIEAARQFVSAIGWCIVKVMKGTVPRTQTAMNIAASDELDEARKIMYDLVEAFKIEFPKEATYFLDSQDKWDEYGTIEARLRASVVEGGSMYPMLLGNSSAELIKERIRAIEKLNEWLRGWRDL